MHTNDTITISKQDFAKLTQSLSQIQKLVNQIEITETQTSEPEFGTSEWQTWADQEIARAQAKGELISLKSTQDIDNLFA
jgi:Asp-tRNA(Asn)/Glu-tRNA(Gln) amidotransferase C subunit